MEAHHPSQPGEVPRERSVPPGNPVDAFPGSFAQTRLWYVEQLDPGSHAYHLPFGFRFRGPLDVAALRLAFSDLVARHESLRTAFVLRQEELFQEIHPSVEVPWAEHSLLDVPEDEMEARIHRILTDSTRQPFALETPPLLRGVLIRISPTEHIAWVVLHHIIADGASVQILTREWREAYGERRAGRLFAPPPLPIQYADFAAWQRESVASEAIVAQIAAWKERLRNLPTRIDLPTDRPHPDRPAPTGGHVLQKLPPRILDGVRHLASTERATPFMVYLAALALLLKRLSGQEDIVIGTPMAAREQLELEGVVGLFLNTFPIRCAVSDTGTFHDLLGVIRTSTLAAFAGREVPFEKLVQELQPERSTQQTPIFQTLLNVVPPDPVSPPPWPNLDVAEVEPRETPSKYDLTLYVRDRSFGVDLDLVYRADLFAAPRMEEFLAQLVLILGAVVEDPSRPLHSLSLVTPAAAKVLPDPRATLHRGSGHSLTASFSQHARAHPSDIAVSDEAGLWSYGIVDRLSDALGTALLNHGIRPGDCVAIPASRGAPLVVATLAVAKSGAAFLILDESLPPSVLAARLSLARPRAWIGAAESETPAALLGVLTEAGIPHAGNAPTRPDAIAEPAVVPAPWPIGAPERPAYILFTSGSTGTPKGVVTPVHAVAHFLEWYRHTFALERGLRFSQLSGIGHDPFVRDVFAALSTGGTLCVPSAADTDLQAWAVRERIRVMHVTPPLARWILREPGRLPDLALVVFGGDRLRSSDLPLARAAAPHARLVNAYGATETPQILAFHELTIADQERTAPPLGRGIDNAQLLVLATPDRQAGIGEWGEIHARTPHLALGYLGDDEASRAAFLVSPFTGRPNDRLYRTGDLGRYLPDGTVQFAGRRDRQIKLRGHRVEPGAVEAVLRTHPELLDAAVLLRTGVVDQEEWIAFVVPRIGTVPPPDLRAFAQARLAAYEVPNRFLAVPDLPLTAHGKLDVAQLLHAAESTPPATPPATPAPSTEPDSETPTGLASRIIPIWAEALGRPGIGIHDDFFESGGHSLLALRLISRLNRELGTQLTLRNLFDHRTIADLTRFLESGPLPAGFVPTRARRMRGASTGIPFFIIPGFFGLGYLRPSIANEVARICPYYDGFRYAGVEDDTPPHRSLEEIAAHLIRQIHDLWPDTSSPLCLAGFSFGGVVAFEMAQQLAAAGRSVPLLILYDSRMYRGLRSRSKPGIALELVRRALRQPRGQRVAYLRSMFRGRTRERSQHTDSPPSRSTEPLNVPGDVQPEIGRAGLLKESVRLASLHAGRSYQPRPYAGRVLLLRGSEEVPNEWLRLKLDSANGWRPFVTGRLETIQIPRQHLGIYTEPLHPLVIEHTVRALRELLPPGVPHGPA